MTPSRSSSLSAKSLSSSIMKLVSSCDMTRSGTGLTGTDRPTTLEANRGIGGTWGGGGAMVPRRCSGVAGRDAPADSPSDKSSAEDDDDEQLVVRGDS